MATLKWGPLGPVNTTTLGDQDDASVTRLADGDYLVVWTDDPGLATNSVIRAQRFNMDGTKDGAEFIAGSNNVDCFSPEVTALANGGYALVYTVYKPGGNELRVQTVNGDGTSATTILNNPGGVATLGAIAAHEEGYALAYLEFDDVTLDNYVRLRLFDNQPGSPFPSEITVSTLQDGKAIHDISVATLSNDNVVVAWRVNHALHYRVYDSAGTTITGDTTVPGTGETGELSLIARGSGFMLAWNSYDPDAGEAKLRGQLFDASGASVGPQFNVCPANIESAYHPEILALPDGRVLAVWFDLDTDTLMGRTFNPATGVEEAPFAISAVGAAKEGPTDPYLGLSLLADGRVVVAWSTTSGDVASQILDPRNGAIAGGDGADTLYGHDLVNDIIKGGGGADTIFGLGGHDTIEGGFNADTIYAGAGNDLVHAMSGADPDGSSAGDTIFGEDGEDTLIGSNGNDKLSGGDQDDTLQGGGGDDLLEGGLWFDELHGGAGKDTLYANTAAAPGVSQAGDEMYGEAGDDTIVGSEGADLLDGGADNDTLSGGIGIDTLLGGTGKDKLAGGLGADTLDGGADADTVSYVGSSAGVIVKLGQGSAAGGDAEGDFLTSIENLTGSYFADTLNGDGNANLLNGSKGDDKINAGGGADILIGGAGFDALVGGGDSDRFDFTAVTDSVAGASRDKIGDFTVDPAAGNAYVDKINVSSIDAMAELAGNQAFSFIGDAAFSAEGQIRAYQTNAHTILQFNTAGTSGAEMEIVLANFVATTLSAADFVL